MAIHTRTPSIFRPQTPVDQSVLTETRKLVDCINRRGLLRGAVSLGALTMLTGCDVSEIDPVQKALRAVYAEGSGHARLGTIVDREGGPFETRLRPAATIITGDFNLEADDPLHARMGEPFADGTPQLADAWEVAHPGEPHPATFKIYEKEEPGEAEQHCDFIFVSSDLAPRVKAVRVDQKTQASDHQPVYLELG